MNEFQLGNIIGYQEPHTIFTAYLITKIFYERGYKVTIADNEMNNGGGRDRNIEINRNYVTYEDYRLCTCDFCNFTKVDVCDEVRGFITRKIREMEEIRNNVMKCMRLTKHRRRKQGLSDITIVCY